MKKQRILLLGGNYIPEPTGIGKYNGEMIDWLSKEGYECAVITSYPYYPYWKAQPPYEKKSFWFTREEALVHDTRIRVYRCPHYIPKSPSGLKRILSDLSFFISSFFQLFILLFCKKFDYVIAVVPPFQLGLLGVFYKWIKGAKFIYHVQDLQIEAAKELNMISSKLLLKLMFGIENIILKKADHISSISDGMIRKIVAKCKKPVISFPNWVDTAAFHPISRKSVLKQQFNFSPAEKIVLYSGAIGEKQGLDAILYAAQELRDLPVTFVICGSGPYKEKLHALMTKLQLQNVTFLPLQPKEKFNEFLNMADLHLVLQKRNANDLVMPSKLSTILSVGGLALVTAPKESSLYEIISRHEMGILVEPEDAAALTTSIRKALQESFGSTQDNARAFADEHLTINKVLCKFLYEVRITKKSLTLVKTIPEEPIKADLLSA